MTNQKVNNSEVSKEAQQLLKDGLTKQEAFETLVKKYNSTKIVADVIKHIPSLTAISKYGKWNTVLLVNIILTAIMFIILAPSTITVIEYVIMIIIVVSKRTKFYIFISALAILSLIIFSVIIFTDSTSSIMWIPTIIALLLLIPNAILPLWLEKKLCPKPIEKKEKYTNTQGEERLRINYEFIY